jgi:hypothetical protein
MTTSAAASDAAPAEPTESSWVSASSPQHTHTERERERPACALVASAARLPDRPPAQRQRPRAADQPAGPVRPPPCRFSLPPPPSSLSLSLSRSLSVSISLSLSLCLPPWPGRVWAQSFASTATAWCAKQRQPAICPSLPCPRVTGSLLFARQIRLVVETSLQLLVTESTEVMTPTGKPACTAHRGCAGPWTCVRRVHRGRVSGLPRQGPALRRQHHACRCGGGAAPAPSRCPRSQARGPAPLQAKPWRRGCANASSPWPWATS